MSSTKRSNHRPHLGIQDLQTTRAFSYLAKHAKKRERLDDEARKLLPKFMQENVRLADYHDRCLFFLVSSPAWASRLRMHEHDILHDLRAIGIHPLRINIRVVLANHHHEPPQQPKFTPLSSAAAQHLRDAAKTMDDPQLQKLIKQLADTARRK